jgi:uncharacterized cupredoxin-like copper-binding protein
MSVSFSLHHAAMLLKYSGISFISGAVNHGFFSGERSLWTAAIGMLLFVIGAAMEHHLTDSAEEPAASLLRTLSWGALLSVGLGFFTGGLQHFPDSPARSAWVVPVGFFISVFALAMDGPFRWRRASALYTAIAGVLIAAASYGAWQWLERHPQALAGHAHGEDHGDGHAADTSRTEAAGGMTALTIDRSLDIRMGDNMRFTPDSLQVSAGETVRLIVRNEGRLPHELVLGSEADIRAHAQAMKEGQVHKHGAGGAMALEVPPGQSREWVLRFTQAGQWQMACLVPGHYEAGMRGALTVTAQASQASPSSQTAQPSQVASPPTSATSAASPAPHHDHSHAHGNEGKAPRR